MGFCATWRQHRDFFSSPMIYMIHSERTVCSNQEVSVKNGGEESLQTKVNHSPLQDGDANPKGCLQSMHEPAFQDCSPVDEGINLWLPLFSSMECYQGGLLEPKVPCPSMGINLGGNVYSMSSEVSQLSVEFEGVQPPMQCSGPEEA